MQRYFIEPRARNYVKGDEYLSFAKNLSNKNRKNYWIQD